MQIARAREPPARLREEVRVELPVRSPVGRLRKELCQLAQLTDRVEERHELDSADDHRPHYHRTRCGGRLAVRLLPTDHRVAQDADALDLRLDHVARPQVERRRVLGEAGHARDRPGREHVAGRVAERRVVAEDLRDRHAHPAGVRRLPHLAVHAQLHREVVRVGDLVGRHDPRPERAEGVDRLAEAEDAGAHLARAGCRAP